jgi:AcrR family transcriptional regulator
MMKRRSSEESKKNILEAAGAVFSAKGYSNTTVKEIARQAGISVGGIYLYYKNKEELFIEIMQGRMELFRAKTELLRREPPDAALNAFMESYVDFTAREMRLVSLFVKEHDLEPVKPLAKDFHMFQKNFLADIFRRGVREGLFRDINCAEVADAVLFSIKGVIISYLTGEISKPKRRLKFLYGLIMKGIVAQKAGANIGPLFHIAAGP